MGACRWTKLQAELHKIFIASYDLTSPEERSSLLCLLETKRDRIWPSLAPACGTSSKAREKKLWNFRCKGFKEPGPLRLRQSPWPSTALPDWIKFALIQPTLSILPLQPSSSSAFRTVFCACWENPKNSICWDYPEIAESRQEYVGFSVIFIPACTRAQETKDPMVVFRGCFNLLSVFAMEITNT